MDEVDGMAGNEDRGGMQELIGIIKTSKVPIICLCNDRQSPKVCFLWLFPNLYDYSPLDIQIVMNPSRVSHASVKRFDPKSQRFLCVICCRTSDWACRNCLLSEFACL